MMVVIDGNSNWKPEELGNVCVQITDGKHGDCENEPHSGFYFLSCKDVSDGKLNYDGARQITEADFLDTHRRTRLAPEDILITNSGTIGRMAMAPENELTRRTTFQKSVAILKPTADRVQPVFLYYALQADVQRLIEFAGGTAQKNLLLRDLRAFEVRVPPLPVQHRIASILSAYDELIENSQRRIRILEEMARALYREWFVHFRFPGHEHHPRVPSSLGEIPKGWDGRFGDLATIGRDGINPFEFPSEQFEHYSIPAFDDGRQPGIELGETILSGKYCIDASCVLLSKLNPRIPRIWLPEPSGQRRAITSTEFLVLTPQSGVTREFIYAKCCSDEFAGQFSSLAIGTSTSHQRVKPDNLLAMPSTVPDRKIVARFSSLVFPMLTTSQQLRAKIQNLRRTRDLLLPRLLSGQIDVEAA